MTEEHFSTEESIGLLCSDIGKTYTDRKYCDVTLKLSNFEFKGHRVIIGQRCKFLDDIFEKEKGNSDIDLSKFLDPKTFETSSLEVVFSYFYNGKLKINSDSVLDVYGLCTTMGLEPAVQLCERFINELIGSGLVCRLLLHARKRNKKQLIETTMRAIENNTEDAMDNEEFLELPEEFIISLLKNEKLTCTEKGLFEGVLRWWCANKDEVHPGTKAEQDGYLMKTLLYFIRFPLMSPDELIEIEKMKLLPEAYILDAFRHHACGFDSVSLELEEEDEEDGEENKKEIDIYKDGSFRTKLRGEGLGFTFNPQKVGTDIVISTNRLVGEITKVGVNQYQMIQAAKLFEHGLNLWEVEITEATNTSHIMIGVCQPDANLNDWCGHDAKGWSWFGYNGTKYNKGRSPSYASNAKFRKGDIVGVKLDLRKEGILSFYLNGKPLGFAFNTLKQDAKIKKFVPAISLRTTGDKVTLKTKYLKYNKEYRKFLSSKDE